MLAARTTRRHEKRNKHWRGKESAAESRTCQRMDTITCLLSDQSNAMCIMAELPAMPVSLFVCMKTRQVSWRQSSSFAQGLCLDLGRRLQHFSWNGAELWLALVHTRGGQRVRSAVQIPSTRAKIFHVRLHGHGMSSKSQTGLHYRGIALWGCKNDVDLVELGKAYYA